MSAVRILLSLARRAYGSVVVLNDASFSAQAGQVLALLGPSGSGKSTILRLIAGLEPLDAGTIHFGDELVSAPSHTLAPERRRVGMVFQDYALFPHLSVLANVAFGLDALPREQRADEARAWLSHVGLVHRADAFPHELSGGEQQRVALARALAPRPRAVLLDEPFSGLDPVLRAQLRDATLAALRQARTTAIFVTHDAEEALLVADKLVILKAGRVLQEASPREAYDHPLCLDAAAALGPVNVLAGIVVGGRVDTPFGAVPAPDFPEGAKVNVAARLEAVELRPGLGARILDRRPNGALDLIRIEAGGVEWRAQASPRQVLGEQAEVLLQPSGVFVFSA